jgi:uncharacterized protein (TIGR03067 family)
MIIRISLLLFTFALSGLAVNAGNADAKKALAAFQGVWKLETIEADGEEQELIRKPPRWVIQGHKVLYGGEELALITLDPATSPKTVDLEFKKPKRTYEGVYTLKDDTLKICVNKMTDGVKERPLGFETKGKPDWRLLVFKRLKEPNAGAIEHLSGFAGIAIGISKEKEPIIVNVIEGTPARKAGLMKDDIILQVGAQDATDLRTTVRLVGEFRPGSEVTFRIKRDGKEKKIKVKVGVLPFFYLD